jgi:uncharacterized repeat protein (TIGR02543 family)
VGDTYWLLPAAIKTDFVFTGWWTSVNGGEQVTVNSTVTTDSVRTLYAHWVLEKQTVIFNAYGGICTTSNQTYVIGKPYGTLPTPTREDYTFAGWWPAGVGEQVTASSIVTTNAIRILFAGWKSAVQIVTFEANGGSCLTHTNKYTIGNTYGILPAATRKDYVFAGWWSAESGGVQITPNSTVSDDDSQTLYAHWRPKPKLLDNCFPDEKGGITVRFLAENGKRYAVQQAETLENDIAWFTVNYIQATQDGIKEFTASTPLGWKSGFYRVTEEPDMRAPYLVVDMPTSGEWTVTNAGQLSLLAVTVAVECFLVFMAGFVQGCKVFGALFDGAGL